MLDAALLLFKCNNPKCDFHIVTSYDSPFLPDSDCEKCRWHDSVAEVRAATLKEAEARILFLEKKLYAAERDLCV
jgi:hypothetical protein